MNQSATSSDRALSNPPSALPIPQVPDHELIRKIGGGSYGEVWLARNIVGTLRAVKIVYRRTFDRDRPYEREYAGIQKFEPISRSHEGFVDILQIGRNDAEGYFYYVMELADDAESAGGSDAVISNPVITGPMADGLPANGRSTDLLVRDYSPRTLRSEIQQRGRLPVAECVEIGQALASALSHLHRQGLVHRDVKPSNIIFVGGTPKLADIGLVAEMSEARSFVGTDGFIPPEGPGTPQADIYSLGKVLYEISTGRDREDFPQLPANLREFADETQLVELNEVLLQACHKDVRQRYSSADAMLLDLQRLQRGESMQRQRALDQRKRIFLVGLCYACVFALLIALGLWIGRAPIVQRPGVTRVEPQRQVETGGTTNREAFAAHQLGRFYLNKNNATGQKKAIEHFEKAVELDPNYALAYAGLVDCQIWDPMFSSKTTPLKLRAQAEKLLRLNEDFAEAHAAMAVVEWLGLNWSQAEAHFQQALRINDSYTTAHTLRGWFLACRGRFDEADRELDKALLAEPTSLNIQIVRAHVLMGRGDLPGAITHLKQLLEMETNSVAGHGLLANAHIANGEFLEGIDHFETGDLLKGYEPAKTKEFHDKLRQAYRWGGARGYWEARLPQVNTNSRWWHASMILGELGRKEEALDWIEAAIRDKDAELVMLKLSSHLHWRRLIGEPRFQECLKKVGLGESETELRSLAVLPFNADEGEGKPDYLGTEIAEEVANALAKVPQLRIVGRNSAAALRASRDLLAAAQRVGVSGVLSGRAQRSGDGLNINVQFVRSTDGSVLWTRSYEAKSSDIFGIQTDIAENVLRALNIEVSESLRQVFAVKSTKNLEAYQAYLEGRFHWNMRSPSGLTNSINLFEGALRLDTNYALAWAGLADAWNSLGDWGYAAPSNCFPKAKRYAQRALELDPNLAEAYTALAKAACVYDWDWTAGDRFFEQAIARNSNYASAHQWRAEALASRGRFDEALAEMRKAVDLDPLSPMINANLGWMLYLAGRYHSAIAQCRKTLQLPQYGLKAYWKPFAQAHFRMFQSYIALGRDGAAVEEDEKSQRLRGFSEERIAELRAAYATDGIRGWHQKRIEIMLVEAPSAFFDLAVFHAWVGNAEEALAYLERGVAVHQAAVTYMKAEPALQRLRAAPRFQALLQKLGLEGSVTADMASQHDQSAPR